MTRRTLNANLNYFQSDNTEQISFQDEVKVRETLCNFELKIAFRHFKIQKRQFDYATFLQKRTENGAQYIKTLTVLCTMEAE